MRQVVIKANTADQLSAWGLQSTLAKASMAEQVQVTADNSNKVTNTAQQSIQAATTQASELARLQQVTHTNTPA